MQDKPNPNPDAPKREIPPLPSQVSGDNIVIMGDVGPGASVGSGSVNAANVAGGDVVVNNGTVGGSAEQFAELIAQLKEMLVQARDKGEMDETTAKRAIEQLDSAQEMVKQKPKPSKPEIVNKLEGVAAIIDSAVETLTAQGSVAMILLKALPVVVMLVQLATKLF